MAGMAGVVNDEGDEEPIRERCERTSDAFPRFADRPLVFEPGTQFRYSSFGWVLLSAAVERAASEPFFAFMRTQVFEPLGMKHTSDDSGMEPVPGRATYYFPRFAADPRYGPQEPEEPDSSCFAGASAFVSTPTDLVRFGLAMHGGTLVRAATVKQFQESQRLPSGEETGYGLGWDIETATLGGQQSRLAGYDGTLRGGTVSSLVVFPERGIVVAVTSNTSFADTYAIAVSLAQAFVDPTKAK
jgi:CubicO group peptidase (beta-lactamase class C family)